MGTICATRDRGRDREQRGLVQNTAHRLGLWEHCCFFFQDGGSYEITTRFDEFYSMDENFKRNGSTSERGK